MKRVCVVTGTRAEYGLLKPLLERIQNDDDMELQLVVTGTHLSAGHGYTYREIEKDGFEIAIKIEMLLNSDTSAGVCKSMGIELISLADYLANSKSDMVILLGDRYEILIAAVAAMMQRIPIAHIHGGEATEGLVDEAIRHAITKMSFLHFTATEEYRRRVIQLGEQPDMVFNVGALGIENIKSMKLLSKEELERRLGFIFSEKTVMVTYHPVTLEKGMVREQFQILLDIVDLHKDWKVIFTKANADMSGVEINTMIDIFVQKHQESSVCFASMGQLNYLSALKYCCMVLGNSSSGIIEAPTFGIPTIDIGDRQKGRVSALSVIHCKNDVKEIEKAIEIVFSPEFKKKIKGIDNPYEGSNTSKKILEIIKEKINGPINLKKKFYDMER